MGSCRLRSNRREAMMEQEPELFVNPKFNPSLSFVHRVCFGWPCYLFSATHIGRQRYRQIRQCRARFFLTHPPPFASFKFQAPLSAFSTFLTGPFFDRFPLSPFPPFPPCFSVLGLPPSAFLPTHRPLLLPWWSAAELCAAPTCKHCVHGSCRCWNGLWRSCLIMPV